MANTKAKTTKKTKATKSSKKPKTTAAKVNTKEKVAASTTKKESSKKAESTTAAKVVTVKKESALKRFFCQKHDKNETILTIFKSSNIYGALIAEAIGTGLVTAISLTLGLANPLYMVFAYVGITMLVFQLSGANLNPVITAGMMASRRMSAIRGVLYFIAQIIGAWAAYAIISAFVSAGTAIAGEDAATAAVTLPLLDELTFEAGAQFWGITMIEFIGAIMIAFAFARALRYKKSPLSFAFTIGAGVFTAMLFAAVITSSYLGLSTTTYVLNPANAFFYGLFPSSAEGFDALMTALMPMLVAYVIFPVLGGILGFWLSDFTSLLTKEKIAYEE